MREVRFSSDARDVELGDRRARRFERAAYGLEGGVELIGLRAQATNGFVGRLDALTQIAEREDVGVELTFAEAYRRAEILDSSARLIEFGRERRGARFELDRRFLEPLQFDGQGGCTLDERRVSRAGIGGPAAQIVGRLTRLAQAPLRGGQPFVGGALRRFELGDRRAPFLLTAIEAFAFLFGLATLARELFSLLREPDGLIGGALQLQFVADDRFLVFVMLGVERGDGV